MDGDCCSYGLCRGNGLLDVFDDWDNAVKPDYTKDDDRYARKLYHRLKREYGDGLNSRQLAKELCVTVKSAKAVMNRWGCRQFDRRKNPKYPIDEIVPIMTRKHHDRMEELNERIY